MSGSEISLISLPISDMLHEKEQERNNKYTLFLIHLNSYNQKLNALKISNIVKIYGNISFTEFCNGKVFASTIWNDLGTSRQ